MSNPAGSWQDAFLVKFEGDECIWTRKWGGNSTSLGDRFSKTSVDLTSTPAGNIAIAVETEFEVQPGGPSARGSRIRELDAQGNVVWESQLSAVQDTTVSYEAIDASSYGLVVTGWHNRDIAFGSSTLNHHSGDEKETMVLKYSPRSGSTRSESWGVTFGGPGKNVPNDIAMDEGTGDIAVVGGYDDQHTHVDGTSAPAATNNSFYIQTLNTSGAHRAADGSTSAISSSDDPEYLTSADFNQSGELFISGHLHGNIELNWSMNSTNNYNFNASYSDGDVDYFIVRFADASAIANNSAWRAESDWNSGNTTSPKINLERVLELTATDDYVAITGLACDALPECVFNDAFAHVFDFTKPYPLHPTLWSDYTVTYQSSGSVAGKSVDHRAGLLAVGGRNTETNYNLGGGQLPGGYGFLAGYSF